jgi:hypothetical protein
VFTNGRFPCMTKQGCPQATLEPGTKGFCPAWVDTTVEETNVLTQETRLMRGCMFQLMPRMMEHIIDRTKPQALQGPGNGAAVENVPTFRLTLPKE